MARLEWREAVRRDYADVWTPEAQAACEELAPLNQDRLRLMAERLERRRERARAGRRIAFLEPDAVIPGSAIRVQDARDGRFVGPVIPRDLERQWIQGTGPATRPGASGERIASGLRNVAYALLSGADGWMFDGEDALGQVATMSLDNQRNLLLAIAGDARFLGVAEQVAGEMNTWARGFFGREILADWRAQLAFTTKIFRARGLHLDDRHVRLQDGTGFSASIVDLVLYVVNNHRRLRAGGASVVVYLPKIQTAGEAAFWNRMLSALEGHLDLPEGTILAYVLVEQLEAAFQLMEIRAALGRHFVGFNTGRWDYINSVSDALAWDRDFVNPNIDAITMTYGYMRHYEDRVRRAVNTPDLEGRTALWQGGMEPNIPAPNASSAKAPPASGSRTGRWCISCARCGSALGPPISWGGSSRASPTPTPTPRSSSSSSRHRARCAARATCCRWRCSTATPSARVSRRRPSSPPISSATTTCSTSWRTWRPARSA